MFSTSIRPLHRRDIFEPGAPKESPLVMAELDAQVKDSPKKAIKASRPEPQCCCCGKSVVLQLHPCGHRVICHECVRRAGGDLRRCPCCRGEVHVPRSFGLLVGSYKSHGMKEHYLASTKGSTKTQHGESGRMEKELARLRKEIAAMEAQGMRGQCKVCGKQAQVFFRCGHTSCKCCADRLQRCHICDKWIDMRRPLFL